MFSLTSAVSALHANFSNAKVDALYLYVKVWVGICVPGDLS
jgi:hypothetical protein